MSDPTLPVFRISVGARELRTALEALTPILGKKGGEARLSVEPDGIRCAMVDASHVAMGVVRFDRCLFDAYHVDRPGIVGVDTERLAECLKIPKGEPSYKTTARKDAVFELTLSGNRLLATLTTPTGATIVRSMATVDPDGLTDPKIPTFDGKAEAAGVDPEALATAVRDAAKVAPNATLGRSKKGPYIHAENPDAGQESTVELPCDTLTGAGRSEYPLDFLGAIAATLKRADGLTLGWAREYPLKVSFRFGPAESAPGELPRTAPGVSGYYLVAPRIEDDGDAHRGEPWYERPAGEWYGWAMRIREAGIVPCLEAATVDAVPTTVIDMELDRVAAVDLAARTKYAADATAYPAALEAYLADVERYHTGRAAFVARWRETHPRDPATRTIRAEVGNDPAPFGPSEPKPPAPAESFGPEYFQGVAIRGGRCGGPDRDARKDLRGHPSPRTSWGPARPEPEPAPARAEVTIRGLEGPTAPEPSDPTPAEVAEAHAPDVAEEETREDVLAEAEVAADPDAGAPPIAEECVAAGRRVLGAFAGPKPKRARAPRRNRKAEASPAPEPPEPANPALVGLPEPVAPTGDDKSDPTAWRRYFDDVHRRADAAGKVDETLRFFRMEFVGESLMATVYDVPRLEAAKAGLAASLFAYPPPAPEPEPVLGDPLPSEAPVDPDDRARGETPAAPESVRAGIVEAVADAIAHAAEPGPPDPGPSPLERVLTDRPVEPGTYRWTENGGAEAVEITVGPADPPASKAAPDSAPEPGPPDPVRDGAAARTPPEESFAFETDAAAFIPSGRVRVRVTLEPVTVCDRCGGSTVLESRTHTWPCPECRAAEFAEAIA